MDRNRLDPEPYDQYAPEPGVSFDNPFRGSASYKQFDWAKEHPQIANALGELIGYIGMLPMGSRGSGAPIMAQPSAAAKPPRPQFRPPAEHDLEVPVSAATKYDDMVFKSPVHGLEEDAALAALGTERFNNADVTMGFVTNRGRFVSREEATALARNADPNYKPYARGMDSDDMRERPTSTADIKRYRNSE